MTGLGSWLEKFLLDIIVKLSQDNPMSKIVFFTGAGISKESGLETFRDKDGMWSNRSLQDLITVEGWKRDPEKVLEFYNKRRRDVKKAEPNYAHKRIAEFQKNRDTLIVTQNIDDLHERAGSENIIHLHGKINEAKNEDDEIIEWLGDIRLGDKLNSLQIRPNVVLFGDAVPEYRNAYAQMESADVVVVIGTSLQVAPASYLIDDATENGLQVIYLDPEAGHWNDETLCIRETACEGIDEVLNIIKNYE